MKRELTRKYLPAHHRQEVFLKLHSLQQKDMTVEAYTSEFEQLMLKSDLSEPEEHTVARFLGGLRPSIGNVVQLQPYWTLTDVQTLAYKVEKQIKSTRSFLPGRPLPVPPAAVATVPAVTVPAARLGTQDVRVLDGKRTETGNTSSLPPARRCFRCQGFGHIASNCPTRNLLTFTEQGDVYEQSQETETETVVTKAEAEGPCRLSADEGEMLMVRRILLNGSTHEGPWLRNNIFHTRCTIQDRICSLIIDSGSSQNVVSANMVKKLGLRTEKHKEPYYLTWLNQTSEVPVTRRSWICFSIGSKLHEQVWCDIVPMDVCHVLLGRPWQYDRRTKHDGLWNTYSFVKDELTYELLPRIPEELSYDPSLMIYRNPVFLTDSYSARDQPPAQDGVSFYEVDASRPQEDDTVVIAIDPGPSRAPLTEFADPTDPDEREGTDALVVPST